MKASELIKLLEVMPQQQEFDVAQCYEDPQTKEILVVIVYDGVVRSYSTKN